MARLCTNENFPLPVADELRTRGHDVVTLQKAGLSGVQTPDPDVLAWAIGEDRAVLTINRKDFRHLHKSNPAHHGIILCTLDLDFVGQAERIHAAIKDLPDLRGQLLRVYRPSR